MNWSSSYRLKHADGHYMWVNDRGITIRDEEGNPRRFIGSIQDIQQLKETNEELQKLSLAAAKSSVGIITTSKEGLIEWTNKAFSEMTGYINEEMIGKHPGKLLQGKHTDKEAVASMSEALKNQEKVNVELINYRKNDETFWVNMAINPVIEDGELVRFIGVATDVTKERKMNERMYEQNLRLKKIAFILSHDLRKPVSSVLGLLELYDKDDPGNPTNVDIIKYLYKATQELDEMMYEIIKESAFIED